MRDEESEFLIAYDEKSYARPSVTNDIIIFTTDDKEEDNQRKVPKKGMQVLLVRRDKCPENHKWSIPGGFINVKEGLEEGARRKLKEKTGIDNVYTEQLYTFGEVNRDGRTRVISIGNIALVEKDCIKFTEVESANESKWFWIEKSLISSKKSDEYLKNEYILHLESEDGIEEINYEVKEKIRRNIIRNRDIHYRLSDDSKQSLAFDHYKILDYSIDRVRNKVLYTPIAFNLLPRLFTVKELQNVYEAIMGREILNFRRKMGDMIIETDEKIEGKPFRPAKVYKFNENWEHNF